MNSLVSRKFSVNLSRSRRALVQPRFLLAMTAMASALGGISYLAVAQTGRAPVKMTAASGASKSKLPTLADLPAMVEAYGRAQADKKKAAGGRFALAVGNGASGFNLLEDDLTPNSNSDDREPAISPGGDFIAFASTGRDNNRDGRLDSEAGNAEGKYHIWVMGRDGSNVRQVTGLFEGEDKNRNQRRPSWSPDGNQLVYVDGDGNTSELFVAQPFTDVNSNTAGTQVGRSERRTFFNDPTPRVTLQSPAWSPSGQTIVFAANANLDNAAGVAGNPFNLFAISPTGDLSTLVRLTGGPGDTSANATAENTVNDLNPAFSTSNSDVIYFSSNRDATGRIGGRRIWRIFADGTSKLQVTDPLQRNNGTVADNDDFPSPSLGTNGIFGGVTEDLSFQSDSFIDASDATANGAKDLNIWSFSVDVPTVTTGTGFSETEPRVFISNFTGNRLESRNPITGAASANFDGIAGLSNPEGVAVNGPFVYVANRGTNQVVRFEQETGLGAPGGARTGINFSEVGSVPAPTGLITDGQFLYVGSATSTTNTAIYRINAFTGDGEGNAPPAAEFSSAGATNPDGVVGGTEGLTFSEGDDEDNDPTGPEFIYASVLGSGASPGKVNVYRRDTGRFVKTFVASGAGGLSFPTDLEFGPDLNGDTFPDLFVSSSGSDDIIAYAGPDPGDINAQVGPGGTVAPGSVISTVVNDDDGNETNLNAPEGLEIITRDDNTTFIYVSSFANLNAALGTGDHVNRYTLNPGSLVATPAPMGAVNPAIDGDASYIRVPGARGLGYLAFNQLAFDTLSSSTGTPDPTPTPVPDLTPLETADAAVVDTNILSSPDNYAASGIAPTNGSNDNVGQDKAPDVEPAFSRNNSTAENNNSLVFASTRRFAPVPGSNLTGADGTQPSAFNPFGAGSGDKHDIWGTTTADTTQPALIPQASGNQLFPVVAPGPQSPFLAPRTAETGLRPGSSVTIAVVISDDQSGLNTAANSGSVVASIRRAGTERFTPLTALVNEALPVNIQREGRADVEATVNLQAYDNGPVSSGGNEEQAGAVAGDGVYYCVGSRNTSTSAGDFYIDVNVRDQAGNNLNYDNIWGYSTKTFNRLGLTSSLLVSDYTTGQNFPLALDRNDDRRFANEVPAESYYLTNNGGQVVDPMFAANSIPTTFFNVDVWRTLSRGAVPTTVLDIYKPRVAQQISSNPGDDATFTQRTRSVAVANSYVVWAAPYAANSFVGPGTIRDATTQSNLTAFMNGGGRLFVSGRDIAFALSNGSTSSNNFLSDELGATFTGETFTNNIDVVGGNGNGLVAYERAYPDTFYDLQLADRPYPRDDVNNDRYSDAAISQQPTTFPNNANSNGAGVRVDLITAGENATPMYAVGGSTVGQRIQQTRANGLESRAVFFSFGLEGVNRRYRKSTPGFPLIALDTRLRIALGLDRYFLTNVIKGEVRNDRTNLPIPNFLVSVRSATETLLARTDSNGNYELIGVPQGSYTIEPAFLLNGRLVPRGTAGATTSPAGFFGGTPTSFTVAGGITGTANLRPIPFSPGSISGRVVTSKGTPDVFTDDLPLSQKAVEMTVLLRSIDPTPLTSNGGRYAQLTKTNFNGDFTFSNVPAGIPMEVVFNPRKDNRNTPAYEGDTPRESNLDSNQTAPKADLGRRVIPDVRRPEPIAALVGNTYVLNDPDPATFKDPARGPSVGGAGADTPADSGIPLVVPEGANISGLVTLNGVPFKSAKVELLFVEGNNAPKLRRTVGTNTAGIYSFTDVAANVNTPSGLATTYIVKVTAKLPDGLEVVSQSRKLTVGATDIVFNFKLFRAKVSGLVTLSGKPTSGIFVQLLTEAGQPVVLTQNAKPFNLIRTATTDSGTTINYQLQNVPPGKYLIRASLTGASGTARVDVDDKKDVVAPTINLDPQKLSGVVNLRVDGVNQGPLAGAQVELLSEDGKSLNPPVTAVTNGQGVYNFDFISAGTYRVRASFKGDTETSAPFALATGNNVQPPLTINLQTITVTVLNPTGNPQSGVTVTLNRGATVVQSGSTDTNGQFKFVDVVAGTYSITATRGDLTQTADSVVVTEGRAMSIRLQLVIAGSGGKTFAANGIYPFSIPFASDGTGATIDQVFNPPLRAGTYKIYRFDAANQVNNPTLPPTGPSARPFDFKEITSGGTKLLRGVGYVVQTFNRSISTRTPMENRDLKAIDALTFTIPLTWNNKFLSDTPEVDNRNNGYNMIGFPFDPGRFRLTSFTDAQVVYGSTPPMSIEKAAAAGIISRQLYTLDAGGARVPTNDVLFRPYGGYFVRILRNDQPIRLILRNPR